MSTIPFRMHSDPCWYTPSDLPAEILEYDTPRPGLAVGSAGKVGLLHLDLAQSGGTTRVVRQFQQTPLYIFHPVYLDPGRLGMAFIYLQQSGEGVVEGDRYRLDLDCAPGTAAHFTTQAATKIYRMEDNFATQSVNLTIGADAFVEYLPDPVIPFRDSRFYQRMLLTVDPGANLILSETLLPGRVAHGETNAYALFYTDIEARTPEGKLLFADRLKLAQHPSAAPMHRLLGAYTVLATLYVITQQLPPGVLSDRLHHGLAGMPDVLVGVSELPNDCGIAVRMIGHTSASVASAMHVAWNEARLALVRLPAPDLRKG